MSTPLTIDERFELRNLLATNERQLQKYRCDPGDIQRIAAKDPDYVRSIMNDLRGASPDKFAEMNPGEFNVGPLAGPAVPMNADSIIAVLKLALADAVGQKQAEAIYGVDSLRSTLAQRDVDLDQLSNAIAAMPFEERQRVLEQSGINAAVAHEKAKKQAALNRHSEFNQLATKHRPMIEKYRDFETFCEDFTKHKPDVQASILTDLRRMDETAV